MSDDTGVTLLQGDCLSLMRTLESESVHFAVTSPPYFQLRSYLPDDHPDKAQELGLEDTPEAYLERMVEVFRELRRVLRKDGTFACNVGDSYASKWPCNRRNVIGAGSLENGKREARPERTGFKLKDKDLMMMPSRLAIEMQNDGWWLRSMLPFVKRSAMPESATDRPSSAIEYVFIFSKSQRYYWDASAVRRPARFGHSPAPGMYDRLIGNNQHRDGRVRSGRIGGEHGSVEKGEGGDRNLRNSDFYFDSLDLAIEATRAELAHLMHLRERGGLLLDGEGEPLALDVNPQALAAAHFASFPERLVSPLIQAGSSEYGVCSQCLAPYVRIVEKGALVGENGKKTNLVDPVKRDGSLTAWSRPGGKVETVVPNAYRESKTTGWKASCQCAAEVVPATILDPFAGSGTTCLVATKLGRKSIGIELSEAYGDIFSKRNAQLGLYL